MTDNYPSIDPWADESGRKSYDVNSHRIRRMRHIRVDIYLGVLATLACVLCAVYFVTSGHVSLRLLSIGWAMLAGMRLTTMIVDIREYRQVRAASRRYDSHI